MSAEDHFQGLAGRVIRPANMDDLPAAVEFFNLYSLATIGVREHSLESVLRQWTSPRFNLESNTRLVLSHEGDWIGYAGIWDGEIPPSSSTDTCILSSSAKASAPNCRYGLRTTPGSR